MDGIDINSHPSTSVTTDFLQNYIDIIKDGNVNALEKILSEDILVKTDGGGKVSIVSELTVGIKSTVDLMMYVYDTYQRKFTVTLSIVNHQPTLLFFDEGKFVNCQVFEIEKEGSKIKSIYSIVDPEKLQPKFIL